MNSTVQLSSTVKKPLANVARERNARLLASVCLLYGALLFGHVATAQTDASRVTPRDLRPDTDAPMPSIDQNAIRDSQVDDLPPEAAELSVVLEDVEVSGGFPELAAATERFIEPFRGRRSTVNELYSLASALEQLYSQQGYFLARVTIPPQDVRDGGTVRFLVIDGYLDSINVDALPARQRAAVVRRLQHLLHQPQLQNSDIERAVILASRTPGLQIRSTLVAGSEPGSTVLVLEGDYTPIAGSYSADNRLSDELGPWQSTLQLQLNQVLGRGEQIYAYVSGDPDPAVLLKGDSARNVVGGGISWPLGGHGTALNLEFSSSDTMMEYDNIWIPDSRSRFDRATVRFTMPLHVRRDTEWTVSGLFEASRQVNDLPDFDYQLYRDELRVVRANISARHLLSQRSQLSSFLQVSQGLTQGARTRADVEATGIPFSRPGARPDFTKLDAMLDWRFLAGAGWELNSTLRAQHAFDAPLPSAELFSLDGDNAISSVESGRLAADSGVTARSEISREITVWNSRLWMIPYAYIAGGVPTNIPGHTTAAGLGLRALGGPVQLFVEYGHSHSSPAGRSGNEMFARIQMVF